MMKTRTLICGFVLGAETALLGAHALSQDPGQMDPAEMQRMMEMREKLAIPGDAYKCLCLILI